ncbi:MAG TPA: ABC transporter permease [Gemmataceae bacterium]|nr:ABC transporter permease [Gemmataceae bacterium]
MSLTAAVRVALGALLVHKGRSFLTSLGIVIGISAVIAMVSAGDGVQTKLDERLATVGKNVVLVRAGSRTRTGAIADPTPLTRDDATALRKQTGTLLTAVAEVQLTQRVVATRTTHWNTLLCGTTPDMQAIREWRPSAGRFFSGEEVTQTAPVCVIGDTVRRKLFGENGEAVGQSVRVEKLSLRVVGVLAPKGRNPAGADQDDEVLLPITTLQRKVVGEDKINIILAAVRSEGLTPRAVEEMTRVLRRTHKVKEGSEDFDVSSIAEMAELAYVVTNYLQLLIAVIASLSLLVGGIGIMNIMLVSVTERTREIGLRMAVGATAGSVLAQFLLEAVILSMLGGLAGITLGLGAAIGLAHVAGWPLVVSPAAVLLAVAVAGAVGVFFGFYPAWKASRLDPIEALRYE